MVTFSDIISQQKAQQLHEKHNVAGGTQGESSKPLKVHFDRHVRVEFRSATPSPPNYKKSGRARCTG